MIKRPRIAAALFAALAAAPLGAAVAGDNLAGVSDAEASFISGGIEEFHSGNDRYVALCRKHFREALAG